MIYQRIGTVDIKNDRFSVHFSLFNSLRDTRLDGTEDEYFQGLKCYKPVAPDCLERW